MRFVVKIDTPHSTVSAIKCQPDWSGMAHIKDSDTNYGNSDTIASSFSSISQACTLLLEEAFVLLIPLVVTKGK